MIFVYYFQTWKLQRFWDDKNVTTKKLYVFHNFLVCSFHYQKSCNCSYFLNQVLKRSVEIFVIVQVCTTVTYWWILGSNETSVSSLYLYYRSKIFGNSIFSISFGLWLPTYFYFVFFLFRFITSHSILYQLTGKIFCLPRLAIFFLTRCYWSKKINRKIWFLISWYRFLVCSRNQFPSIVKLFLRSNISCFYLLFFFRFSYLPWNLFHHFLILGYHLIIYEQRLLMQHFFVSFSALFPNKFCAEPPWTS